MSLSLPLVFLVSSFSSLNIFLSSNRKNIDLSQDINVWAARWITICTLQVCDQLDMHLAVYLTSGLGFKTQLGLIKKWNWAKHMAFQKYSQARTWDVHLICSLQTGPELSLLITPQGLGFLLFIYLLSSLVLDGYIIKQFGYNCALSPIHRHKPHNAVWFQSYVRYVQGYCRASCLTRL